MNRNTIALVAALALSACNQPAAEAPADKATEAQTEAQQAYAAVNDRMHQGMAAIDADADVAFMQGMLAHHRGAVEMSEVLLKYGKDPKTRTLAARIIQAQLGEIAEMESWLKARGVAPVQAQDQAGHADH